MVANNAVAAMIQIDLTTKRRSRADCAVSRLVLTDNTPPRRPQLNNNRTQDTE
jgi:hypothetical protein